MTGVLESLPRGARVAVVRLRSLGDCVLTTPALQILERARPDLQLAVVVEERFRAVFAGDPGIAALLAPRLADLRRFAPDLCLNFHGGGVSARLTALSGARLRAGFGHFRFGFVYNLRIPRAQEILGEERKVHTAEHLASAVFWLGAPRTDIPRARLFAARPAPAAPYAVLHPAASAPSKTWPAQRFLAVAEYLRGVMDLRPVFIGAPGDDLAPFAAYETLAGEPLERIKSLLSGAVLFVGNDSGPAHMAAAFGVPEVIVFGDSDRDNWRPWRTPAEVLHSEEGIAAVSAQAAIEAIERLRVRV
ncbi:MAG: glycosyltransferase family 9 protein [Bryobacteraceae bacterium]